MYIAKHRKAYVSAAAAIMLILAALATQGICADIEWTSYDDGIKQAAADGKPALVSFSTTWCGVCKKMEGDVFSDEAVKKKLADGFVSIKVDGDKHPDLTGRYKVFSYPTNVMLDKDGKAVYTAYGYLSRDEFVALLDYVSTGSCGEITFKEYLKTH